MATFKKGRDLSCLPLKRLEGGKTDEKMFFQCEQTAGGSRHKGNTGVCGKTAEVAAFQDS